ncbi:helix-turn-helix transcriptional regulator [Alicyclobacillus sp. SO9]|uniref:helix-turn-helix transcriptional regulator n=1 Tax=Alicyclobacillus sp. SO9 TaxID=2665646 RepID=UPI0018E78806|nr:helix-turn-helix transcriptional regulator [Alicyclobacillus sp. SO9]QQE78717.1 helix-turn-helix transcriptional regulator [Alicyclobacillus sp. SO9]
METTLKQILEERDIQPAWVAHEAGISRGEMRRLMNGRAEPTLDTARQISRVLGLGFYELWPAEEAANRKASTGRMFLKILYTLYNYAQYPVILVITFLMIRYSTGYSTHPGVHVAMSTALIDVLTLRNLRRWNIFNLGSVLILNVFGAYIILRGGDPLELKVAGWYVLSGLLIALTNVMYRKKAV